MSLDEIVMIVKTCLFGLATMVAAGFIWHERAKVRAILGAVRDRFLTVSFDEVIERLADTPEQPNDRAPRSNAIERGSVGSVNVQELPKKAVIDDATLLLIQQIAAHKVKQPSDGKEATALAVSGAKKGSSKAYQAFAQAWDLLYPPLRSDDLPAGDPNAWEAGKREGQIVRKPRPRLIRA